MHGAAVLLSALFCAGSVSVSVSALGVLFDGITNAVDTLVPISSDLGGDVVGYGKFPDEFALSFGYPAERHEVTTDDGYVLKLFRVPAEGRPPVLLMHGLGVNALCWTGRGQESLPLLLADAGFDVWVGCARGTICGKQHTNLSADTREFWDYSWHENGIYDVPAIVSHIVQASGQEKIQYVGHSMGTTMFFVMCSVLPSCREHIRGGYLLAPVAYLGHLGGVGQPAANALVQTPIEIVIDLVSKLLLHDEFQVSSPAVRAVILPLCKSPLTFGVCLAIVQAISGVEARPEEFGLPELQNFISASPDSFSYKQIVNYGQLVGKPNLFQRYDHESPQENLARYGSEEPPRYPLQNITVPVSLYYGERDVLGTPQDAVDLAQDLPNVKRRVYLPNVTHVDFLAGESVRSFLYDPLIEDLKKDIAEGS